MSSSSSPPGREASERVSQKPDFRGARRHFLKMMAAAGGAAGLAAGIPGATGAGSLVARVAGGDEEVLVGEAVDTIMITLGGTTGDYQASSPMGEVIDEADDVGALINGLRESLPGHGGVISLPGGDLRFKTPIEAWIDPGDSTAGALLTLRGVGPRATQLVWEGAADATAIRIYGDMGPDAPAASAGRALSVLEGFRLIPSTVPAARGAIGVSVEGATQHFAMRDVAVEGFDQANLLLTRTIRGTVMNCVFNRAGRNSSAPPNAAGAVLHGADDSSRTVNLVNFYGCQFNKNGIGVRVEGQANHNQFLGCNLENNRLHEAYLTDLGSMLYSPDSKVGAYKHAGQQFKGCWFESRGGTDTGTAVRIVRESSRVHPGFGNILFDECTWGGHVGYARALEILGNPSTGGRVEHVTVRGGQFNTPVDAANPGIVANAHTRGVRVIEPWLSLDRAKALRLHGQESCVLSAGRLLLPDDEGMPQTVADLSGTSFVLERASDIHFDDPDRALHWPADSEDPASLDRELRTWGPTGLALRAPAEDAFADAYLRSIYAEGNLFLLGGIIPRRAGDQPWLYARDPEGSKVPVARLEAGSAKGEGHLRLHRPRLSGPLHLDGHPLNGIVTRAGLPDASDVPEGGWGLFFDKVSGNVVLAANHNGSIRHVALSDTT